MPDDNYSSSFIYEDEASNNGLPNGKITEKKYNNDVAYVTEKNANGQVFLKNIPDNAEQRELRRLMNSYNVFSPHDLKYNTTCYRYPKNDPYNFVDGAREYIFITKIDLPFLNSNGQGLAKEINYFPYIKDLWECGYVLPVFANLCKSLDSTVFEQNGAPPAEKNYPFMRILSNRKTSNIDLPDITAEEYESATNLYGSKIVYSKSSALSDENGEFSIEFDDTKFLEIYNLFKVYDLYRQGKWLGWFGPGIYARDLISNDAEGDTSKSNNEVHYRYLNYITNKILYDHMAIYKFLVASDGFTILHGARYTGCFPKSISRSSLSELDEKGGLKITVNFKVSGWLTEDMVEIARDFNAIIFDYVGDGGNFLRADNVALPVYDNSIDRVSQESADFPFIRKNSANVNSEKNIDAPNFKKYCLLWGIKNSGTESQHPNLFEKSHS